MAAPRQMYDDNMTVQRCGLVTTAVLVTAAA
jgi:hypothetical protein